MEYLSIILIAIGLSADSFAVSVSCGLINRKIIFPDALKIAFPLAFFQAGFTFTGWLAGSSIRSYIESVDHWVAFILLIFIGVKMIYDSLREKDKRKVIDILNPKLIITMSVATSIDALIIGVSFAMIYINILNAVLIIGTATFFFSMLGILVGKKTAGKFGKKMEILGGVILIGIGIKILIEHLWNL